MTFRNAQNSPRSHCKRGHALEGHNLLVAKPRTRKYVNRQCRECRNAKQRERLYQRKLKECGLTAD